MNDRQKLGLRGPVRSVVEQYETDRGTTTSEQVFDLDGKLVVVRHGNWDGTVLYREFHYDTQGRRLDPNTRILRHAGGGRTETCSVSGLNAWSIGGLHGVGFGTMGASLAESSFDADDRPLETVFRDDQGNEFSRISYFCDTSGNIVEAVQHSGAVLPLDFRLYKGPVKAPPAQRAAARAFFESGVEQFRLSFRYDDAGRVVDTTTYIAGQVRDHTVSTYNESGDMSTSVTDNQPQARFEYEYDKRGNWVRKAVLQTWGSEPVSSDEYRRTITYYD